MFITEPNYLLHFNLKKKQFIIRPITQGKKMIFILILLNLKFEKRTIQYKGSKLWNNLLSEIDPLKSNSAHYYTLPYMPNLPFLISDIRALWRSGLSAKVLEWRKLKNGRLGRYGAEHSKCNRMTTLGFKGLKTSD